MPPMGLCQSGDTYHRPACPAPSLYWFLKGTYKIWRMCNALLFIHGQPEAVPNSEREIGNVLGAKSTARTRVGLVASRVHSPGLSVLSRLVLVFGGVIRNFLGGAPNSKTHQSSFSRTWWHAQAFPCQRET